MTIQNSFVCIKLLMLPKRDDNVLCAVQMSLLSSLINDIEVVHFQRFSLTQITLYTTK